VQEVAVANFIRNQELYAELSKFVENNVFEEQFRAIKEQNEVELQALKDWATPNTLTNLIQQNQRDLADKIRTMEISLSTKLDRSEVSRLEAVALDLERYSSFRDQCVVDIERLQESSNQLKEQCREISQQLKTTMNDLRGLESFAQTMTPKRETRAVAGDLEKLKRQCDSYAHQLSVEQVTKTLHVTLSKAITIVTLSPLKVAEKVRQQGSSTEELRVGISDIQEKIGALQRELPGKADVVSLKIFALKARQEQDLANISTAVDSKASSTVVQEQARRIEVRRNRCLRAKDFVLNCWIVLTALTPPLSLPCTSRRCVTTLGTQQASGLPTGAFGCCDQIYRMVHLSWRDVRAQYAID